DAIAASGLAPEQLAIIAFDAEVIAAAKRRMPEVRAFWLTDFERRGGIGGWRPTLEQILATLERIGADGLDCRAHASIDEAFVKGLRDAGHAFHVWTVDDPAVALRFRALGVDSITTNRPAWLRAQLEGTAG
ncbi:MAG: glycerophosphodiester phosphodiesterase, partial [Actinobacteria bacterium]|nr:glycerophosphodiester phosphodiesterase [Actinomycetota bacterium]